MMKKKLKKILETIPIRKKKFFEKIGPGLVTGAADDDPSGIATYSQVGAKYGFQMTWLAVFSLPFMSVVQEMCARIGIVTGQGLAANIRAHFPRWILISMTGLLFLANAFNIGADLGAMAEATRLLAPNIPFLWLVAAFAIVCLCLEIFIPYREYVKYLKWLTFVLFAYVFAAFLIDLAWIDVLKAVVIPTLTLDRDHFYLIAAVLGTTISPYLFFWQSSQEIEEEILLGQNSVKKRQASTTVTQIKTMRQDVWLGMFFSNLIMFFIIVVCGATLNRMGMTNISTAAEAAAALKPIGSGAAYILFTLGIIGTGLLAIPVLAGSASYAIAESFGWKYGLYRKFDKAKAFYGVIIVSTIFGSLMNFIGLNPIKALIYSAVINAIVAPAAIILIIIISSDRKIMGQWANNLWTKIFGWVIMAIMILVVFGAVFL